MMARLLFTTHAFNVLGRSISRVPILLDHEMRLVEPACAWLLHIALVRGRTRSVETWRTYAEALYDWWQTLEANGWEWDRVTSLHVAAYRDRMLSGPSAHTTRPYSRSTINARVRTLAAFYSWCVESRIVSTTPFPSSEMRVGRTHRDKMLVHIDASGGIERHNELTVRHTRSLPRPLPASDIRKLARSLSVRDRLIVEWALMSGTRRMEVAAIRLEALTSSTTSGGLCRVPLLTTKGGKPRHIYPPLPLVDRTRAYVREERAVVVARAKRRGPTYTEPATVFLALNGSALGARSIGAMFAAAARKVGLETSFHALRHTFAVTMLHFLQRQAARSPTLNPLLTLQVLLGHSDISSTSIYLQVLATDLSAVEQSVDDLYEALH